MNEWLSNIDNSILQGINQTLSNSVFDSFFPFYTDLHKLPYFIIPAILILVYLFYRKYQRQGITYFIFLLLALSFGDFTGSLVKNYFLRPRPFTVSELHITQRSPANPNKSFYSNHASNSFTFAVYTAQFFPQAKLILYPIAALVGYSRMYNGVHYPSDVITGGVVGSLIGLFFSFLAKKITFRLNQLRKDRET